MEDLFQHMGGKPSRVWLSVDVAVEVKPLELKPERKMQIYVYIFNGSRFCLRETKEMIVLLVVYIIIEII